MSDSISPPESPRQIPSAYTMKAPEREPSPRRVRQFPGEVCERLGTLYCFPCRRCPSCRERLRRKVTRLTIRELKRSRGAHVYFLTQTFRGGVCEAEVMDWWATFRSRAVSWAGGGVLRWVRVIEYHKDGRPHLHALVISQIAITWRRMDRWMAGASVNAGHRHHKIVRGAAGGGAAARYVAKYVGKSGAVGRGRIRMWGASPGWGALYWDASGRSLPPPCTVIRAEAKLQGRWGPEQSWGVCRNGVRCKYCQNRRERLKLARMVAANRLRQFVLEHRRLRKLEVSLWDGDQRLRWPKQGLPIYWRG